MAFIPITTWIPAFQNRVKVSKTCPRHSQTSNNGVRPFHRHSIFATAPAQTSDKDENFLITETQSNPFEKVPNDPSDLMDIARIVSIKLPLDLYLEESSSGAVYVAELVPGGNAEKSGQISEGDIIAAVSIPFGEAMMPVPEEDGVDMVYSNVLTRDEDYFRMAILPPGADALSKDNGKNKLKDLTIEQIRDITSRIYRSEYPSAPDPDEDDEKSKFNLDILREQGYDV